MNCQVLYISYDGLLEPLGQSQVLAYLRGLSRDHAVTLITYEKDEDRADAGRMAVARAQCAALGIIWLPQRFRYRPRFVAPALSMLRMAWLARREVRRCGIRLIHARSYIPTAVAMMVSRLTGTPFIFDMRALWPEELNTAGRLRRGSLLHRATVTAELAALHAPHDHSALKARARDFAVDTIADQYLDHLLPGWRERTST